MNFLVTAGPTREPLDPVRFLSNRSTGKMGYAIAAAAASRGHHVVLISGPVALNAPEGVQRIDVTTAAEMLAAVTDCVPACEALVMAAAVADWTPRRVSEQKIKKTDEDLTVEFVRTADVLASIRHLKGSRIFVGFAAETQHVLDNARKKLAAKGLDLIVANDVSEPGSGFAVDTNRVTLIAAGGEREPLPLLEKSEVAARLVDWVEQRRCGTLSADMQKS